MTVLAQPRSTAVVDLRSAGKQVARTAGGGTVAAFFEANKNTIAAVLPQHMAADRMMKVALRCLRTTPKLMECSIESLFGAVVTAAQLGLEPNTPQGHLYLVPYENRKKNQTEVQVLVGYKGLIDLARRSGEIESISARVVYSNDDFSVEYGTADRIVHKPHLTGDRGAMIGVYAVARLKGGGTQFEFLTHREVKAIAAASQSHGNFGPWKDHFEEMARKTAIRRLAKYLPMSIELANAAALDERAEAGKAQSLDTVLEGEYVIADEDEQTSDTAQVDQQQELPPPPETPSVRQRRNLMPEE